MKMIDIIDKKRQGLILTRDEINFWINGISNQTIPDYQTSALAMAIVLKGMSKYETYYLTSAMKNSGECLDLSKIDGFTVDKHSTGGVGDKVSLVLSPMVAACGVKVAKMSGRGLGHTGGTLDKLESIPGLTTSKTNASFIKQVNDIGLAIISQTTKLAPADKKLYALRDVTATVNSIPLIASSVMSKKIACGADAILLDVTVGKGAFMKNYKDANKLANLMISIGRHYGKDTRAFISNMNEPLGHAIGNALEMKEAIKALKGEGPEDLMKVCYTAGAIMLIQSGKYKNMKSATKALQEVISNGKALKKLADMVQAQGGDISYIYQPELFKTTKYRFDILAREDGYIKAIDCLALGYASMDLGAGRMKVGDPIDMAAGIYVYKKIGDQVKVDDKLATIYTNKEDYQEIIDKMNNAFTISSDKVSKPKLILKVL